MTVYVCKNRDCNIFFNSDEKDSCPNCGTLVELKRRTGSYRRKYCWVHEGYYRGVSGCPVCHQVPSAPLRVEK